MAATNRAVGVLVQRRIPLVGLAADQPVEVLEATAWMGPMIERPGGGGFRYRDLVALAEQRGAVAVELQRRASGAQLFGRRERPIEYEVRISAGSVRRSRYQSHAADRRDASRPAFRCCGR